MKGKQLAILLALVVVLGGAGWYLQKNQQSSWTKTAAGTGGKVLNFPLNDVEQITIKGTDGEVNLAKKDDVWVVSDRADYPANFSHVSELLRTAWELKVLQDVKVGPTQLGRLELGEPGKGEGAATLLEFKDKDGKRLEGLLLGKVLRGDADPAMAQFGQMAGMARGRYVKPAADGAKVALVSESFERAETKPEKWLQQAFIKVENIKSVNVVGTTDAQKWKLTRETPSAEWKLDGAKPDESVDTSKVSPLNFTYSNPSFADVLAPNAKPEETGLDKPSVATLETTDGFTYTLKIGKPMGENYPVKVEVAGNFAKERTPGKDEKPEDKTKLDEEFKATLKKNEEKLAVEKKFEAAIYLIAKPTIEPLLRDRSALIAEKKPETPAAGAPGAAPSAPGTPPQAGGAGGLSPEILEQIKKQLPPGTNLDAQPAAPPARPIEAVTPPIAVPPAPPAPAEPAPAKKK
jgi:hypothetical protein